MPAGNTCMFSSINHAAFSPTHYRSPLIIAFDPAFNNRRRYALEHNHPRSLSLLSTEEENKGKEMARRWTTKYRAMKRATSSIVRDGRARKRSANTRRSRVTESNSNKYIPEFAMKVMKANYPSGIVLKQSGLFVNIRRRVCWEPRVPRLSAWLPPFRLDSFNSGRKLVNLLSLHRFVNIRCASSPILNFRFLLFAIHVRSSVQIELRENQVSHLPCRIDRYSYCIKIQFVAYVRQQTFQWEIHRVFHAPRRRHSNFFQDINSLAWEGCIVVTGVRRVLFLATPPARRRNNQPVAPQLSSPSSAGITQRILAN